MANIVNKKNLEKNIGLYSWFKILTKRVFLPLITIQLVNAGHVTLHELAIIAGAGVVIQVILQMPSGYIADKWGNRSAIIIGCIMMMFSPLFYIVIPNFGGGLIAALLNFGGYTFLSGAIEAFIHDTLIALERQDDYSKVMGRAQSYGLIGNIVLISLVPATYSIDQNLPFLLGFVAQLVMLLIALNFTFPLADNSVIKVSKNPFDAFKKVVNMSNVAIFIFAGLMAGVMNQGPQYRELLFENIGINVAYFGVLLALGSLAGAGMGWFVHLLDKVSQNTFYFLDLLIIFFCLLLVGITKNPIIVVVGFSLFAGYSRVRLIIVQAKILQNLKHTYKATLLSALSLFTSLGDLIAVTLLAMFISNSDLTKGYLTFSLVILGIGTMLWAVMVFISKPKSALN